MGEGKAAPMGQGKGKEGGRYFWLGLAARRGRTFCPLTGPYA